MNNTANIENVRDEERNTIAPFSQWLAEVKLGLENERLTVAQLLLMMDFYLKWEALGQGVRMKREEMSKWLVMGWWIYQHLDSTIPSAEMPD